MCYLENKGWHLNNNYQLHHSLKCPFRVPHLSFITELSRDQCCLISLHSPEGNGCSDKGACPPSRLQSSPSPRPLPFYQRLLNLNLLSEAPQRWLLSAHSYALGTGQLVPFSLLLAFLLIHGLLEEKVSHTLDIIHWSCLEVPEIRNQLVPAWVLALLPSIAAEVSTLIPCPSPTLSFKSITTGATAGPSFIFITSFLLSTTYHGPNFLLDQCRVPDNRIKALSLVDAIPQYILV